MKKKSVKNSIRKVGRLPGIKDMNMLVMNTAPITKKRKKRARIIAPEVHNV